MRGLKGAMLSSEAGLAIAANSVAERRGVRYVYTAAFPPDHAAVGAPRTAGLSDVGAEADGWSSGGSLQWCITAGGNHHLGSGSRIPQVVVPQMFDQFYFARRVEQLGIGTAHSSETPTVDSLLTVLSRSLEPGGLRRPHRRRRSSDRRRPPGCQAAAGTALAAPRTPRVRAAGGRSKAVHLSMLYEGSQSIYWAGAPTTRRK